MNTVYSDQANSPLSGVADSMCDRMDQLDEAIKSLNELRKPEQKSANRLLSEVFSLQGSTFQKEQDYKRKNKIAAYVNKNKASKKIKEV